MDISKVKVEPDVLNEADTEKPRIPRAADTLMRRIEAHGHLTRTSGAAEAALRLADQITAAERALGAAGGVTRLLEQTTAASRAIAEAGGFARTEEQMDAASLAISASGGLSRLQDEMTAVSRAAAGLGFEDVFGRIASENSAASEAIRRAMDPYGDTFRAVGSNLSSYDSIPNMFEVPDVFRESSALVEIGKGMEALTKRFTIPEFDHLSALSRQVKLSVGNLYGLQSESILKTFESLRTPWLDSMNELASAAALARVQSIGHMFDTRPAFDFDFTALLRTNLGDWRDPIVFRPDIIEYPVRRALYDEHGFDRSLVERPDEAFDESLELAGFAFAPTDNDVDGAGDEAAQARTNRLHAVLLRFEIEFRRFVDDVMTEAFGEDWMRHRLPNNMLDGWIEKQRKDPRQANWRPIDYLDFTEYVDIVCKRDIFPTAFATFFDRPESFRESMQRLAPSRHATMHARPLGRDDVLFAVLEIRRLMMIIRERDRG